jgi:hypothetical protein
MIEQQLDEKLKISPLIEGILDKFKKGESEVMVPLDRFIYSYYTKRINKANSLRNTLRRKYDCPVSISIIKDETENYHLLLTRKDFK